MKMSRESFLKPTGSTKGVAGAGCRSTGRAKLRPNNNSKTVNRKSVERRSTSSAGKKGNRGPKRT